MKKKNPFGSMQNAAVGMAGLGITTGIVAGVNSKLPSGSPSVTEGMNTLTSFVPLGATAIGARTVLDNMPKVKKYKWGRK